VGAEHEEPVGAEHGRPVGEPAHRPAADGQLDRSVEPPRDAEEWTDEQWLAYLDATDDGDDEPATRGGRVARSSGGQMLGNAMLGLAQAMFGAQRPEIVVEAEVPGGGGDDDVAVQLDPDHPERSTVVIRRRVRAR